MHLNKLQFIKKAAACFFASSSLVGTAGACQFSWFHIGDESTKTLISQEIGAHVTDEYCVRFNKNNQLFIQSSAYALTNMAAGHAIVGIRPRGSKAHPIETFTMLSTDTDGRTSGDAQRLAVRATVKAIDNLMSELNTYKVSE